LTGFVDRECGKLLWIHGRQLSDADLAAD